MKQDTVVTPSSGFPPIAGGRARVLILGSLPGQRSLLARQYYAHPQNAFWRIMQELTGAEGSYQRRCSVLVEHGIALWDVLAESVRPGSMDADIRVDSAEANDFAGFLAEHREIELICFNGQKAAKLYQRLVVTDSKDTRQYQTLPSTSPAYASMPYALKLEHWCGALRDLIGTP